MRRTFRWLGRSAAIAAALLLFAAIGIVFVLDRGLASFGITLPEAYRVLRVQQVDAMAIRDAEGPVFTLNGIAERGFVRIGGIRQWVTIRGDDRRNPAVLILHGGPGDAYSQLAYFYHDWERAFTVVQWDQRGAGRTYRLYGMATPDMTLDQLLEDGAEVADYARRRLNRPKIILLGHSWGSALGALSASYYTYTLTRLTADHETAASAELKRLGPPPYRTIGPEETVRKWPTSTISCLPLMSPCETQST
ncbi:MAG TPA: alpha/beta fold hydrolase [Steroidobacteraceae bacterium]